MSQTNWKILERYGPDTVGKRTCEKCGVSNSFSHEPIGLGERERESIIILVITNGEETRTLCADCGYEEGINLSY